MKALSIDIETLGTLVDSQIISIGLAMFDLKTGKIGPTLYIPIFLEENEPINATIGTIKFWALQAVSNPEALEGLLEFETNNESMILMNALLCVRRFVKANSPDTIWANSPKFDLSMLEYQYNKHELSVPWRYNADRCMRTLRQFAGKIDIEDCGTAHNALSDAIWQAKYISAALRKLRLL